MKRRMAIMVGWFLLAGWADAESVRVVGQRVNLRARADLKAEVVGQVADGDVLEARSIQEEWVEVVPPESVDLWVHKDFVQGGKVAASELKVRAGPGINYSVVATLDRGTSVSVRGEFTEWLKIAPPSNASLWVSKGYVESGRAAKAPSPSAPVTPPSESASVAPPPPGVAAPVSIPPPPPLPPSATSRPRPPPGTGMPVPVTTPRAVSVQPGRAPAVQPPPPGLALIPFEGQGRAVQYDGVLKTVGHLLSRPTRFRLVSSAGNQLETLCYVYGNDSQLNTFLGRRLLIRGREYWVRGVQSSVVVPDQIIPRAAP
jgi:SH3-like domain-containing protein